jgi:hypothetical protein
MKIRYILMAWIMILGPGFLLSRESDSQFWWQVKIFVTVKGEYVSYVKDKGFDGRYSFTSQILGAMQEDERDFIFVQALENATGLKWVENLHRGDTDKQLDLSGKIKPAAKLNYVFRTGEELFFDIDIEPVTVPYENSFLASPQQSLLLPKSAGDETVQVKSRYNKGIESGSNHVVIAVQDFYDNEEIERRFQWLWMEKNASSHWRNNHEVELTLQILRLKKKES